MKKIIFVFALGILFSCGDDSENPQPSAEAEASAGQKHFKFCTDKKNREASR